MSVLLTVVLVGVLAFIAGVVVDRLVFLKLFGGDKK